MQEQDTKLQNTTSLEMESNNERRLTENFSGGIIEMAFGVIPSICSFTKADMAMSGRPAAETKDQQRKSDRKHIES